MLPRRIVAGTVWHISRRTVNRHYLFTPDPNRVVEGLFWFCLGHAAARYGIEIHAATLLSTHHHCVVTDTRGELPRFLHEFHRNFACCIKALLNWPGQVFDSRQTSAVELVTSAAITKTIGYVIANPVAAGAVKEARQWPGACVLPKHLDAAR